MKNYCFILFVILLGTTSQAQPDLGFVKATVIRKQGDTIDCFIERAISYSDKISYKLTEAGSEEKMRTKDIKSIKTPFIYYENIQSGKKELLMALSAEGKITLYYYFTMDEGRTEKMYRGNMTYSTTDVHYVVRKDGKYQEMQKSNYKEILAKLLDDCPGAVKQIDDATYKFENMEKIIKKYNTCQQ